MGRLITLIFIFILGDVCAQGFIKLDTLSESPKELGGLLTGTFKSGLRADFDGDGKADYICQVLTGEEDIKEYWITSDLRTNRIVKKYVPDYDYFWLVNLDEDAEPEIVRATGYEDGIDYSIHDSDIKTGIETLICYFNPVIIENGKNFWGYPWDIGDIIVDRTGSKVLVRGSMDHDITRDGVVKIPKPPSKFPVIFFTGHSTQPDAKVGQIRNVTWLALEDLR